MASYHTEEKQTTFCVPCQEDGQNKEAYSFCFECAKHFCSSCEKSHNRFIQNHNIIAGQDINLRENYSPLFWCELHSNQRVDLYCTEHNFVLCKSCRETDHEKCSVRGISEVCQEKNINDEMDTILQHASDLKRRITNIGSDAEAEVEKFNKELKERKDQICEFRREIIDLLSRYEEKLDKYMETTFESRTAVIETSSVCLEELEKQTTMLTERRVVLKQEALFVSLVKFTNYCSEFEKNLKKVLSITENHSRFKFDDECFVTLRKRFSKMISEQMEQTDSTSSDELNQFDANTDVGKSFCNVKACTLTKEIVIVEKSTRRTGISDCCFMPIGHVVLCDFLGRKLILLNKDLTIKCYMSYGNRPFAIAVVDKESVVVSFPNEKSIQFISVKCGLRFERKVQLNESCYGIVFSRNTVFVGCYSKDQEGKIIRKSIFFTVSIRSF